MTETMESEASKGKARGRLATADEVECLIALLRRDPPRIGVEATINLQERAGGGLSAFYHRGWDEYAMANTGMRETGVEWGATRA